MKYKGRGRDHAYRSLSAQRERWDRSRGSREGLGPSSNEERGGEGPVWLERADLSLFFVQLLEGLGLRIPDLSAAAWAKLDEIAQEYLDQAGLVTNPELEQLVELLSRIPDRNRLVVSKLVYGKDTDLIIGQLAEVVSSNPLRPETKEKVRVVYIVPDLIATGGNSRDKIYCFVALA